MATRSGKGTKAVIDKGAAMNTRPNQRGVLTTRTGPRGIRRLRALNPMEYITLQRGKMTPDTVDLDKPAVSANEFYQRGRPPITRRISVRRLFRHDPYNKWSADAPAPFSTGATEATMSPVALEFSDNTNPQFHPESVAVGSVMAPAVKRQPQAIESIGGDGTAAERTHGNVIKPNRQTTFGGKTLRRR